MHPDAVTGSGKETHGELEGLGGEFSGELDCEADFRVRSSRRFNAAGLAVSDFKAAAASPRVASFLSTALDGEAFRSALTIAASKAFAASSLLPVNNEARP